MCIAFKYSHANPHWKYAIDQSRLQTDKRKRKKAGVLSTGSAPRSTSLLIVWSWSRLHKKHGTFWRLPTQKSASVVTRRDELKAASVFVDALVHLSCSLYSLRERESNRSLHDHIILLQHLVSLHRSEGCLPPSKHRERPEWSSGE